ncbi:response regulator transcription factor [Paenibacillus sp. 7124]|uniref:Response regulator transcription factor n=1 Tax=Paenibacillus apii TaxID=1850370 RepID=A0A6M1PKM3_9BACL|nr:response regulator transcription factor [Paenibacillus apii]NGM80891.1 response regulator transcription factor [Paenibacillus apii]NJJ40764.1 response regulator transcription factor [Paenibacillus apii]
MTTILIVEDDRLLLEGLVYLLEKEQYEVLAARSYQEGADYLQSRNIHLALLDIRLPGGSGTELCREIRRSSDLPVIFLTANDTEPEIVAGFDLGADDYIAKPFSMEVLLRRVRAVLKRAGDDEARLEHSFIYKDLKVNFNKMTVFKNEEELKLTTTEYRLLEALAQNSGQVMTREMLLNRLWDQSGNFVDENTLSVNIKRLRDKLEDDPKNCRYIKTVFGIGYTWGDG